MPWHERWHGYCLFCLDFHLSRGVTIALLMHSENQNAYGSQQDVVLAGESPAPTIVRFGWVVNQTQRAVTNSGKALRIKSSPLFGTQNQNGGNGQEGKQTGAPQHKEMSAAPKVIHRVNRLRWYWKTAEPSRREARPMLSRKQRTGALDKDPG